MKILSFDISSVSTGWSLIEDGYISSDYGLILPDKKYTAGQKLSFFKKEIVKLIKKYKPDHIGVEDIFKGRNMNTFKILAQFRGVAIQTIYENTKSESLSIMAVEARRIVGLEANKEAAFIGAVKMFNLKGFDFEKHNDIVDSFVLGIAFWKILNGTASKNIRKPKKRKGKIK